MKRKISILGIALALFCILGFTGCQNNSSESKSKLYYVEVAEIDKSDYETIIAPYKASYSSTAELNFNEIKTIRLALRNCETNRFDSETDVSKKDLKTFLTSHGCTPSEANEALEELKDRGNAIWLFNSSTSASYVIYFYIEEQ